MRSSFAFVLACSFIACTSKNTRTANTSSADTSNAKISWWLTKPDRSALLQQQPSLAVDSVDSDGSLPTITIDSTATYQSMEGFGFTLTGGSAEVIQKMEEGSRTRLLHELFGNGDGSIGISFLRLSIGASDLNDTVFTYDDMPPGKTDPDLRHFSLAPDTAALIPLLRAILLINPNIHFLGSPWSPPSWMKDNDSSTGGSLKKEYYEAYAKYFVRYVEAMKAQGITIHAITPQNEPLNPANNPSLLMPAEDQAVFVRDYLGPAFRTSGVNTRIILYDHNCDHPDYPMTILKDAQAAAFVDGSAFHLYAGDISALTTVHNAYPGKDVYFTEQYTAITSDFAGDLLWHFKNLVIGAPNNWARTVLEWNLANDTAFGPHTPGGCTTCKGALTIGAAIQRNVAYYIIGHASKFVKPGSRRIQSVATDGLACVAFKTPGARLVTIVLNEKNTSAAFRFRVGSRQAKASLPAGSVATFVW